MALHILPLFSARSDRQDLVPSVDLGLSCIFVIRVVVNMGYLPNWIEKHLGHW